MNANFIAPSMCALAASLATAPFVSTVEAPGYKTSFVSLGQDEPGVLYEPVSSCAEASIAFFAMHARCPEPRQ